MRVPARALLAAAAVAGAAFASPALAGPPDPPYECVMYPCYPEDWVYFLVDRLGGDEVYLQERGAYNCVTEPCPEPPPYQVCIKRVAYCTQ